MSFNEKMLALANRVPELLDHVETEEATKNALVMPFIAALGYNVFDPMEVIPEYTADVGTKKGEKVDYAIMRDGEIIMIVECKKAALSLDNVDMGQLYRYFSVTKVRIAVMTNGVEYRFFSDLEETNKMDPRPFLDLNLRAINEHLLTEVGKLSKDKFDLEKMLTSATELKFTGAVKKILGAQLEAPEEELVRFFFARANPSGRFVASAKEAYTPLVRKALQQFVNERVNDRLRSALEREDFQVKEEVADSDDEGVTDESTGDAGIVTTEEEIEGFHIVKAIVAKVIDPSRISYRDTKTYMGVLLDENNRKALCRLWFNRKQKYIGLFDEDKNEQRKPIENLQDIYSHSDHLRATALRYDHPSEGGAPHEADDSHASVGSDVAESPGNLEETGH